MVIVKINNPKITEKYTKNELNYLFSKMLNFLEKEDKPTLCQVDINDLPKNVKKDLETPDDEIEYVNL